MSVKDKVKGIFGWLRAKRFGGTAGQGVYIGKSCSLKEKKRITLGNAVIIRPYAQIWSGGEQ